MNVFLSPVDDDRRRWYLALESPTEKDLTIIATQEDLVEPEMLYAGAWR